MCKMKSVKLNKNFLELVKIMSILRSKNGCPWDRKQTHKSILPYLIEEAYELIEAINKNNINEIKEELGDLLLQVIFHSQIAKEKGKFDIDDVVKELNRKLIVRHPHVFAGKKGLTKDWHVREFWEKEKKKEKKRISILDGVPQLMPALLRARRLISKAKSVGFAWKSEEGIIKKIKEELKEVEAAIKQRKKVKIKEEIGDLFFVIVALCYFYGINPEEALQNTNKKFIKRFKKIEKFLYKGIKEKEMLDLWGKTK